jgi:hypothetical protein
MASGFQNTGDRLIPTFYRVTMDLSGYSTTSTATDSGGVEVYDYNSYSVLPTSVDNSVRRARGNIRWQSLLDTLSRYANPIILDVTPTKAGPTALTASDDVTTALSFTVGYEQEDYVLAPLDGTNDSAGNNIDTVAKAIKELITQGITIGTTKRYRVYNTSSNGETHTNVTVSQPDTPANVNADITVSLIDTMTQINS